MKTFLLIISLALLCNHAIFASVTDDFAEANQAYGQKDFGRAISTYETLVRRGEYRPEIFHNLGLAYEQSANPAKAILNFERALLLNVGMTDAQAHLNTLTGLSSSAWWQQIPRLGSNVSILVATCAIWCIILALTARWRVLGGTRTFWSLCAILSFFALAASTASYIYRDRPLASPNRAIVLKSDKLRSNFTETSPTILSVKTGQPVEITSVNGPWTQCLLPDKTRGWLPTKVLERVIPQ